MRASLPYNLEMEFWKKCNSCKRNIGFQTDFWVCNVSTCNRKRTGLIFCSVSCWDAHLAIVSHRESWAEERRSPSAEIWKKVLAGEMEWDVNPKKEAPAPTPKAPVSTSPKILIRRKT